MQQYDLNYFKGVRGCDIQCRDALYDRVDRFTRDKKTAFYDEAERKRFIAGVIACLVDSPEFTPGSYHLEIYVTSKTTGALGHKWLARPRNLGSFTVLPHGLREKFPGVPTAHTVSAMPPVAVSHS